MSVLAYLIPVSIILGAIGLAAFLWSCKSGQYQDLDGAAQRVLFDEEDGPHNQQDGISRVGDAGPEPN